MNITLPRTKWILKGCPVCRGDLFFDVAGQESGLACLQCSRVYEHASIYDFLGEGVPSEAISGSTEYPLTAPAKSKKVMLK